MTDNKASASGKPPRRNVAAHLISLLAVFAIVGAAAIIQSGRFWGHTLRAPGESADTLIRAVSTDGGRMVANTTTLCAGVSGFGGAVPLEVYATDGRIDSIRALENQETPAFFSRAFSGLREAWNGMTLREAADYAPDGVTGATFSSNAIIANARAGALSMLKAQGEAEAAYSASAAGGGWSVKHIAVIIVLLAGCVLPLCIRNPRYRLVQQLFNVAVLGFWAGTFMNYTLMLNFISNGVAFTGAGVVTILLFFIAFIYPLFGFESHYCGWICPLGSIQELAGHLSKRKINMGPRTTRLLTGFRQVLWAVLMILLWLGIGSSWIDYELFAAFVVESAGWVMISVGLLVVVLAIFIPHPYCRFICPTGALLKKSQSLS